MTIAQTVLTWLSVPVGFLSALLWYWASKVAVCEGDPKALGGYLLGMKHPWSIKVGKPIDLVGTMAEGARLNKLAAVATAIVVLLQGLANGVGALAERQESKVCQTGAQICQSLPGSPKG